MLLSLLLCGLVLGPVADTPAAPTTPLKVLFLGDNGHHQPAMRYRQLASGWANQPIKLEYTEDLKVLNPETLSKYDALMVYANHPKIEPEQEKALLEQAERRKAEQEKSRLARSKQQTEMDKLTRNVKSFFANLEW